MEINIKGNPGQGNTFQEIHINKVDNFNPNATTVINNYYGDKQKPHLLPKKSCRMQSVSSASQTFCNM